MALDPKTVLAEVAYATWPDCFICILATKTRYATYKEVEGSGNYADYYCDEHKSTTAIEMKCAEISRRINAALELG